MPPDVPRSIHEVDDRQRLQLLIDAVADYAIYLLDPDGVVSSWNSGAERIKGYRAGEIIGQNFSRFFTPEDRAAGRPAAALAVAARDGRCESEGWRQRRDGSRFWCSSVIDAIRNPAGTLIGFAKVTRDISERRAAQDALRQSEQRFRLLVNGVTDYALYMLDPDGVVSNWNAGAERIKGYRAAEIVGHSFARFFTETDRAAGLPQRALAVAAREGRFESEGWRVRKDGTLFWAMAVLDAIRDESGRLIGFAKITRDITERRQAQAALQKAQERIAQAQKMEALGQLTGGVAHDFNNLLMIVGGQARIIRRLAGEEPRGLRAAEAIELAVKRGAALTRQLLSFARRQRLEPQLVDIAASIATYRDMLASTIGGSFELTTSLDPELWPVRVDPGELELALVNVVVNARDAMPDGGRIGIAAQNVELTSGGTQGGSLGELDGRFVRLSISDTGMGIPADILPQVFDPFFTTKAVDKGTGLGLSQVHGFAHQSGGTVTIDSEVGRGTRISIYLPRAETEAAPATASAEARPVASQGGCVLLVEDNPQVAEVTLEMLQQLGHEVRLAASAAEALQQIEADVAIDLVVSDIVMAGAMDGLGLARRLRQQRPQLPVLLVTGYSKVAEAVGVDFPILRKPYELGELGNAISRLIAKADPATTDNLVEFRRGKA